MQNNLANGKTVNQQVITSHIHKYCYTKTRPSWLCRRTKTELNAFSLLFSNEMIGVIVFFTNKIMELNRNAKNLTDTAHIEDRNSSEMRCLFGLLLFRGVHHGTKKPVKDHGVAI